MVLFFLLLQINEIPKLTSGCTEFIESAEQILEERKMNHILLANHSTLLDLLEIPQLMDTYVFEKVVNVVCEIERMEMLGVLNGLLMFAKYIKTFFLSICFMHSSLGMK